MSGAGRGTPRIGPYQDNPPTILGASSSSSQAATTVAAAGGFWGYNLAITAPPLLLTTAEVLFPDSNAVTTFRIPYGAIRGAIVGVYSPAAIGGQLSVTIEWGTNNHRVYAIVDVPNINYAPVAPANPQTAQTTQYQQASLTPPVTVVAPVPFLFPFAVPTMLFLDSIGTEPYLPMRFAVREAGGVAEGTVDISNLFAESFGENMPLART